MRSAPWLVGITSFIVMITGLSLTPQSLSRRQVLMADNAVTATVSPTATVTPTPTAVRVTVSPTATVTPTPTPTLIRPEPGPFRVEVVPSSQRLFVGETLETTVYLFNETEYTCFGIPQFSPSVRTEEGELPALEPVRPTPVTLSTSVGPGGSLSVDFVFRTVQPGIARIYAGVSGERFPCHADGVFDWGFADGISEPIDVIEPYERIHLPLITRNRGRSPSDGP